MTTEHDPLVSVILPTFNRAPLILRSIESVLHQSYRHLELIVVDDGSTDGTREVVLAIPDSRIRYVRCPHNGGPGYARNRGLQVASGPLIAFQDSDDEWMPDKLAKQVRLLQREPVDVGLVCSAYRIVFEDGNTLTVSPPAHPGPDEFENDLLRGFRFIPPTWLVRRECLDQAGPFDEHLPNREDWELVFRIIPRWRVAALSDVETIKHVTPLSVESNWPGRVESYRTILARHEQRWSHAPELKAIHLYELGRAYAVIGEFQNARAAMIQAARLRPFWFPPRRALFQLLVHPRHL